MSMESRVGILGVVGDVEEGPMAREPDPAVASPTASESTSTPPATHSTPASAAPPTDPLLETFGIHALLTRYRFAAKFAAVATASAWYALFCTADLVVVENSIGNTQVDLIVQRVGSYKDEAPVSKVFLRIGIVLLLTGISSRSVLHMEQYLYVRPVPSPGPQTWFWIFLFVVMGCCHFCLFTIVRMVRLNPTWL
ncbi:hypothetical protein BDK51DRAFT_49434 [Blyttiomyces helicus]|uniref:Uncharacterized protein n=1 Tax=Blyttiomyces helicus TaxID=388810 RepID=A0A4P9W0M5_9FUNG|nr:hypothetical protein BDK51DRAFT_49434 [Blyttiomyces helicus]|eukprot:RKO84100.1 hypothetical protein BDK51DRAFT_49434 [Blyttiomyces helicus]